MKNKSKYFISSIILMFIGFVLISPESIGLCLPDGCMNSFRTFVIGQPLFYGMMPIVFTFLIFLFVRDDRIGDLYKKFIPFLVISIVLVAITPLDCNVLGGICLTKSVVALSLGVVFFVYSMIKIIRNKFK